ncbi:hypothetical protein [Microbacterium thalli]|uniref:Uncharacterized protein n=1 Tax=Microbacterium thalli TaxID=3027921 RepID=A0ABT5SJU5_9MICO|nr:hypothetical protein [Microbacterium thalli]MDD7963100.1 hypothetical protein [Microbacterium thalli]
MLTLITREGLTLTASTHVELASMWADQELGAGWDQDSSPFDVHTTMWEYIENVDAVREGAHSGYSLTVAS